ncbi:MAG: tetratricopeptide repeat protein [Acidobacteriota bacterium]
MNRDNALFLAAGILVGFLLGYFLFESVAERQPPRLPMGAAAAAGGVPPAAGAPAAGAVEGPFMAQVRRLEERLRQNPEDADAVRQLSDLYVDAQAWEPATQGYARYLQLRPGDPDILSELGTALYQLGRYEEALQQFDLAQEIAPNHWESLFNRAVTLAFGLSRWDDALAVVEQLRSLRPDDASVQRLAEGIATRRGS